MVWEFLVMCKSSRVFLEEGHLLLPRFTAVNWTWIFESGCVAKASRSCGNDVILSWLRKVLVVARLKVKEGKEKEDHKKLETAAARE